MTGENSAIERRQFGRFRCGTRRTSGGGVITSHHNQAITILSHHNIEMNGKIGTID
jgi:hypothetical protein